MTEQEYTLTNNRTIYGVISTFFGNSNNYYFVSNGNLIEFARYRDENNLEKMMELASPILLSEILSVSPNL